MDERFQPRSLYTVDDLLRGYVADDDLGVTKTFDFEMYRHYTFAGGGVPISRESALDFATHDAYIANCVREWIEKSEPHLVGIMGGHSLGRDHRAYQAVARLARALADTGYLVTTGGGPGAMEAGHLGAATQGADDGVLQSALEYLADEHHHPGLPNLDRLFSYDHTLDVDKARAAHNWFAPAHHVWEHILHKQLAPSLAIPTWLYGNEPTMPFATTYAKYFNNSIREEALVSRSAAGMIYAQGGGGTIREIFQDMEENYYARDEAAFTPMIFFDPDKYWEMNGVSGIKLDEVVHEIVRYSKRKVDPAPYLSKILFSTDTSEIVTLLDSHKGRARATMMRMISGQGFLGVPRDG